MEILAKTLNHPVTRVFPISRHFEPTDVRMDWISKLNGFKMPKLTNLQRH